jgi:hypothetical protein
MAEQRNNGPSRADKTRPAPAAQKRTRHKRGAPATPVPESALASSRDGRPRVLVDTSRDMTETTMVFRRTQWSHTPTRAQKRSDRCFAMHIAQLEAARALRRASRRGWQGLAS